MELLLGFAERRFIEICNIEIQEQNGNEWITTGRLYHRPTLGSSSGVSWHHGHNHLQDFLINALPKLLVPEFGEGVGVRQALQFYRTNFHDDFVELQYLKTWIAIEILFSRDHENAPIFGSSRFKKFTDKLSDLIDVLPLEPRLTETEKKGVLSKLGELRRPPAIDQAMRFLTRVLKPFPEQTVSEEDLSRFIAIRNKITHGGTIEVPKDLDYPEFLNQEHHRLQSLLERVLLAMFDQDANLMSFSWANWLAGR